MDAYKGSAPYWFQEIVHSLYPRFIVEKQRFELEFFLYKADQIVIRTFLVLTFSGVVLWFKKPLSWLQRLARKNTLLHFNLLTSIFYLGVFYYSWHWVYDFDQLERLRPFYKAVHLYNIFHLKIPEPWLLYTLYAIYLISLLSAICRYKSVLSSFIASFLLILFHGYFLSFEKIDHGQSTLIYAAILLPFMRYELKLQSTDYCQSTYTSFTLFLIQLSIAASYLLSGLEKIFTSGFEWVSAQTFRSYLMLHDSQIGIAVANSEVLSSLLPLLALLFQLGFIGILLLTDKKEKGAKILKYMILLGGIAFHLGTKLLMDIGPYFSSWMFVYIFFLDWNLEKNTWLSEIISKQRNKQKGV
ncbi:hypothetical protein PZB74_17625 [Porifericola rhodea]|uniref:hypothetical protein n=1 Tax=Porifericola rhodea TaxID=930972 RepID=UPI0026657637|nr:hypothetical protein [Porifericola rhodea]WKN30778.1 hypothetical protein PZB74_17625 [Porifericola rhodea]